MAVSRYRFWTCPNPENPRVSFVVEEYNDGFRGYWSNPDGIRTLVCSYHHSLRGCLADVAKQCRAWEFDPWGARLVEHRR